MITVNLHQAQQIVEVFGGDDSLVSLSLFPAWTDTASGDFMPEGLYAWFTEYPEEGRVLIPESADKPEGGK